jgi:MFS family permease
MLPGRISGFLKEISCLNKNVKVYLITIFLINLGFGVFQTDFNLYILSLGLTPDFLGIVLSLTPFAQALAAIPIGFLAEKIGHKRSMILVNLVVGLAYLMRVINPNRWVILASSFLAGIMACGYFIIQLPFLSHYSSDNKNLTFTFTSIIFYTATAIGALIGGFLPHLINLNQTASLRLSLAGSSLLIVAGTIPLFFLDKDKPADSAHVSLSPYLTGIDRMTVKFASVELFIGLGFAFLLFFMNLFFIYHYDSTIEAFGVMNVLLILPMVFFLLIGPALAKRFKNLPVILVSRFLGAILAVVVGLTANAFIGGSAFIFFRTFISLSQTLWFAYAISTATKRSRMATSAWLEITFQIGLGIAALIGGRLVTRDAYFSLGLLSALSMGVSFLLTFIFFGRKDPVAKETDSAAI